jgi:hypothetical protein
VSGLPWARPPFLLDGRLTDKVPLMYAPQPHICRPRQCRHADNPVIAGIDNVLIMLHEKVREVS